MGEERRQLGRYELVKRIALGGMGEIYLAKSRGAAGFEKTVIIKKILEHLAAEPEFVTKFLDEGRIVVHLAHGNIVPVFDMGAQDGEYFIAMEYVAGRDLRDVLKRLRAEQRHMPVALAVYIAVEICKGLDYAHRRAGPDGEPLGIVHRDISPSNILLSREGEVKIIDFGIARAASRLGETLSGRIQGKVCYMSPEQAAGQAVDARSDIFSSGVLLYEMLTGVRAFQGTSDLHSLDLVRRCEFSPPSMLNPQVPTELEAIVGRAMAQDCAARYQSADQLQVDLLQWLYAQGRAVTAQQLAGFVGELFPEGFERAELRQARDPGALNLDEALNAELRRLGSADTFDPPQTRTLSTPAAPAVTIHEVAPSLPAQVSSSEVLLAQETSAPREPPTEVETSSSGMQAADTAHPGKADERAPALIDTPGVARQHVEGADERAAGQPQGFKRWLAGALLLGALAGGAALYFWQATRGGVPPARAGEAVAAAHDTPPPPERADTVPGIVYDTPAGSGSGAGVPPPQPANTTSTAVKPTSAEPTSAEPTSAEPTSAEPTSAEPTSPEPAEAAAQPPPAPAPATPDALPPAEKNPPAPARPRADAPRQVTVAFASNPPGATIVVNGRAVDGPQQYPVGAQLSVDVALDGYKPRTLTLVASAELGPVHRVTLVKLANGCILVRPNAGQQVEVLIDGKSYGTTSGARFDAPVGARRVELVWGDGSRSEHVANVTGGSECVGPLGFSGGGKN